jgi:lipoyl(octanoyl) transferase
MKWRFLVDDALSAAENMAIDEAIMISVAQERSLPTIRFYDWQVPTLSYGYHQQAEHEIDFVELKKKGYDFVRRPTGGRMVLHKNEVTYAVIAPVSERLSGNTVNSYREISMALAEGLRMMGLQKVELEKGELSSSEQRLENNPCFSSSSRYEIKLEHKKIIGSAQVRKDNVLLQHGSILLNNDQSEIADFIPNVNEEQKKRLKTYLSKKTIAINQVLEKKINFATAVEYFMQSFQQTWIHDTFISSLDKTSYEVDLMEELRDNKYTKQWWNLKKKRIK